MIKKMIVILVLSVMALMAKEAVVLKKVSYFDSIKVKEIEAKKLYKLIEDDVDDLYIVDIREPDQIGHGEIFHHNLVAITRGYLEFKIQKEIPDKKARIVVYCCTGKRGKLATKTLNEMGYTNVYSLKGGIKNWVESGYPLDTVYGEVVLK